MQPTAQVDPDACAQDRGGRLRRQDFARLARFIEGYAGIKMPPAKITMLEGRLHRRVRARGLADVTEYCRFLFDQDGLRVEAEQLIDAVSTNKTDFFREPDQFRILRDSLLPALLSQMPRGGTPRLNFWSAACSTGAEPYTIAMVLAEFAREQASLQATILATDINTEVLATARHGIYAEDFVAPVAPELRRRYLLRGRGNRQGTVRVVPELRAMVHFQRLNLIAPPYDIEAAFDVIFCRNVLIYFNRETQQGVLSRLCAHLRPGGTLFLGHSESITGLSLPLLPAGHNVFRRV